MNQLCKLLVGKHDFTAFGAKHNDDKQDNPVKDIWRMEFARDLQNNKKVILYIANKK